MMRNERYLLNERYLINEMKVSPWTRGICCMRCLRQGGERVAAVIAYRLIEDMFISTSFLCGDCDAWWRMLKRSAVYECYPVVQL